MLPVSGSGRTGTSLSSLPPRALSELRPLERLFRLLERELLRLRELDEDDEELLLSERLDNTLAMSSALACSR